MRLQHVGAGSSYVGRRQPLALEAYLATCVGVALTDAQAGVGGLGHYLLPEPVSPGACEQPEKYAATGLPLLIRAVGEAGGRRGHIQAHVAGGALVGPLDQMDLDLNIGGRTVQVVEEILAREEIPVATTETGGFFTCCLTLNLKDLSCRIEPAGMPHGARRRTAEPPTEAEIDRVMAELRPVPQAALRILRLIEEEEYDIRLLTREIRKDQVISARTLQLANSVMFASRSRIESLDHALMHLGVNLLTKFVIAAALDGFFAQTASGYSLCKGGLYHHAVGAAAIAEQLARRTGAVRPGQAYTAALLHDIGKVVLDQYVDAAYPLLYRELCQRRAADFTLEERAMFGVDHTEVGGRLAERWGFPEALAAAVGFHHRPEAAVRHRELVHVVHLADLLVAQFRPGFELERLNTEMLASRLAAVRLEANDFAAIVDALPPGLFQDNPEAMLSG
jgi:putative nucleotidyltransferase with HDIG domain